MIIVILAAISLCQIALILARVAGLLDLSWWFIMSPYLSVLAGAALAILWAIHLALMDMAGRWQ